MTTTSSAPTDEHRYPIAEGEAPSRATFLAVGEATDRDPLDLPPLGRTIDTDSLDDLVGSSSGDLCVRFAYAGCSVTLTQIEVRIAML
jgi:hypothetical protein